MRAGDGEVGVAGGAVRCIYLDLECGQAETEAREPLHLMLHLREPF